MRAGDQQTCSAIFHSTTAMGYCSRCGGSWKNRRRKLVIEVDETEAAMDEGWDPSDH